MPYNVFCTVDELVLTSTSAIGIYTVIDKSNEYIVSNGLTFNPTQIQCATFGNSSYTAGSYLNTPKLSEVDRIQYLGAILSDYLRQRAESRISACGLAFYVLRGAGLCKHGTDPDTTYYLRCLTCAHC